MLFSLLDVVRVYGGPILVHVDGPTGEAITPDLLSRLNDDASVTIFQSKTNAGIGAALNDLVVQAGHRGCDAIIFFDQDSLPLPTTAGDLRQAFAELEAAGWHPAIVGPGLLPDPAISTKVPRYRDRKVDGAPSGFRATDFVIISGSLTTLSVMRRIGPYKSQFRMDAIDVEWCFRAWSKGFTVWYIPDVKMEHRVGNGIVKLGYSSFPLQSVERMGGYARNQFHMLRLGHVPLWWKLRTVMYVPLQLFAFVAAAPDHRWRRARKLLRSMAKGSAQTVRKN